MQMEKVESMGYAWRVDVTDAQSFAKGQERSFLVAEHSKLGESFVRELADNGWGPNAWQEDCDTEGHFMAITPRTPVAQRTYNIGAGGGQREIPQHSPGNSPSKRRRVDLVSRFKLLIREASNEDNIVSRLPPWNKFDDKLWADWKVGLWIKTNPTQIFVREDLFRLNENIRTNKQPNREGGPGGVTLQNAVEQALDAAQIIFSKENPWPGETDVDGPSFLRC
jgi:hypothetical protein